MKHITAAFVLLVMLCGVLHSSQAIKHESFDVRHHLSTVTRYDVVRDIVDKSFVPSEIPEQCTPIHLNLLARHGTRAPTKKKMKALEALSVNMETLVQAAKENNMSLQKIPSWIRGWRSPWKGKLKGGELISEGEKELYNLGIRTRERFPVLFNEEYHPDAYTLKATQIPRASASAVAFGLGLFGGSGNLGSGHHRAFAVSSESRASDTKLRFHDCCQNYKAFRRSQEPAVDKLKWPILDEITNTLFKRTGLKFTREDTSMLWFLCKQEASLLNISDQACAMFSPSEVALLEWTDDLELFLLKGYGNALNYRMGVPLLEDVIESMEQAIKANDEQRAPGSYEKARLRFAHAETLLPFSCLIGLFLEGSEFESIQREQPLQLPPKPPQTRKWKGSIVTPFGGNNMLILYSCPVNNSSKFLVQVLHNEHPVPVPGCNNSNICPYEVFKERIAAPHLKHDYNRVCNAELKTSKQKSTLTTRMFSWLFANDNVNAKSYDFDL
ncbi:Multiple inositol polyphosphate phosphatase 1 [Heracleum sosnowskyi]|uniref:Multiple inositol polyphosphate phosphatase 1 n=1 Tax=Heracleum sosnowskyi TaxID=360622 RepID=A0AAD8HDI5_9APIA|nr:Multiple inositol polyphosphate phosphatase 1 [Heracleum sosnowskyi]